MALGQTTGTESRHGMWTSRWLFVLAAAGSAVGLGNIWKFPYIAGENGGGAFVLVYLACVAVIGIPIMMAEVLIGREGRQSPINTMRTLIQQHHRKPAWVLIGWMGVLAGFLILSYYGVIAGWALSYIWRMADGSFIGASGALADQTFSDFLADPWKLIFWQTIFMVATVYIISRGVTKGLERAVRWFMPMLFVLLAVLLGYAVNSDGFAQGWDFMFGFNWDAIDQGALLVAMGHAFFTLSLGMGAIMVYGAYLPSGTSIAQSVVIIAILDTAVAIAAGLAIFPIVFANGLEPSQGPGLMFVTLPLAFGQMPLGALFGTIFFVLVSFAAITSAISISEPALAYLVEQYNAKRWRVAVSLGVICWALGLLTVFSFNVWSDVYLLDQFTAFAGKTIFDLIDYLTANVMLPLGGMFIALFAAFGLPKTVIGAQLGLSGGFSAGVWKIVCGVVAPVGVLFVVVAAVFDFEWIQEWLK
ncbi:MAG: sodium-dependent transporter [Gammaproteobacteria bacterium]|nr:sodium-dependent transporter [Gammaproteobacteria bacterium]